jgi:hypothetical protein
MLKCVIVLLAWCWVAIPVSALELRFEGVFTTLLDCPGGSLGTGCGSPPLVDITPIPFAFSLDVTGVQQSGETQSTHWTAPAWPMPPPITRSTFESLSNPLYRELFVNNGFSDDVNHTLLWNAARSHVWSGSLGGSPQQYFEQIGVSLAGQRSATGAVTFAELSALFQDFLSSKRPVPLTSQVSWFGTSTGAHELTGDFRLVGICRGPTGLVGAVVNLLARVGPG